MKLLNKVTIEVKKSKFIAYAYEVTDKAEVQILFDTLKKEHKKARHIPYAVKIDNYVKKSDDKEPQNSSGLPIYNIIDKNDLNNIVIFVVRFFGGIKLGVGGLHRAYGNAAKEVIVKK
ncbi:MAG: YigZ family protein [bacterium]